MAHPLIIALVALLLVRDAFGSAISLEQVGEALGGDAAQAARATLFSLFGAGAFLIGWVWRRCAVCNRRMARRGANVWALKAHRAVAVSRAAALLLTALAILLVDAVAAARLLMGDRVLLDEAVVAAPALLVMIAGWWALHPVEKRLREAVVMRRLDEGGSIHPMPGRLWYTWDQIRHSMLATLIPVGIILGWSEWIFFLFERKQSQWSVASDAQQAALAMTGLQLAGAVLALLATPLILRFVWDMVPLREGAVAQRVRQVCSRHGVKVGAALVWRTHGALLNAAVLGFVPPFRYLLLSDALLEALPEGEIEAVAAHEVGHVRRRHLPWLLASLIACFGLPIAGGLALLGWLGLAGADGGELARPLEGAVAALGLGAGFLLLGFVSRRFEWQADAFAVQHMSGMGRRRRAAQGLVASEEAANAMAQALGRVAMLNGVPAHRFGWRHGSIAERQRRIRALVGTPLTRLPIDRVVGRVKLASLAGAIAAAALATLAPPAPGPRDDAAPVFANARIRAHRSIASPLSLWERGWGRGTASSGESAWRAIQVPLAARFARRPLPQGEGSLQRRFPCDKDAACANATARAIPSDQTFAPDLRKPLEATHGR